VLELVEREPRMSGADDRGIEILGVLREVEDALLAAEDDLLCVRPIGAHYRRRAVARRSVERHEQHVAASQREGMAETLTLTHLGVRGKLKSTLQSTNPIESMIGTVRRTSRNVKRWQSGDMCLRWTAAGTLEAEQQFRKIIGYGDLAKLALAIERDLIAQRAPIHTSTEEDTQIAVTV
jgi:hypothetical protein